MALRWATGVEMDFLDYQYKVQYPGQRLIWVEPGEWLIAIPDDLPTCDECGVWDEYALSCGDGWCGECGNCDIDCECD